MSPASYLLFIIRDASDATKPHLYPQILSSLVKKRFITRTKMCRELSAQYHTRAGMGNICDTLLGRREEANLSEEWQLEMCLRLMGREGYIQVEPMHSTHT